MASVKKNKNGTFTATISIGRDDNGKHIRKYITCDTEKECKTKARELETELTEGTFINIKNIRLSTWLDEWLEMNKNTIAPSTYILYKGYIRAHYKPALGDYKLSQLNEIHIKMFINEKLETLTQNTVRKLLFVLRKALFDAMKHKSPAKYIEVPSKQKTRFRLITEDEFNMIYEEAKKDILDECIILLAAWCGFRRSEIFAIKPNDISIKNNTITIDEARTISDNGYIDKRPKSENGFRTAKIPIYLIELIDKYRKQQEKIDNRLFNLRPDSYTHRFKRIVNRTNINNKNIVFHDLRHYHASWLYSNNIPDLYAIERLGLDINTLKKIYQHLDKETKKEYDNKILNMAK